MNELKPEDVMKEHTEEQIIKAWEDEVALGKEIGLKRDFINYVSISLVNDTLAILREKDAEIESLRERNITLEQKLMLLGIDEVYVFKAQVKGEKEKENGKS